MKSTDQRFIEHWTEVRKDGRWVYAIKRGVLFFALPIYTGTELIKYFFRRADYDFSPDKILLGLVIWTVLGLLSYGFVFWKMQEQRYQELQKKDTSDVI